jgi:hypothetical protein
VKCRENKRNEKLRKLSLNSFETGENESKYLKYPGKDILNFNPYRAFISQKIQFIRKNEEMQYPI